jgi:putative ABC transport system ATP-binding protein
LPHCAAALERCSHGQVQRAGWDITNASDAELTKLRRGEVDFVFLSWNFIGALTAEQNVALPGRLAGQLGVQKGCSGDAGRRGCRGPPAAPAA